MDNVFFTSDTHFGHPNIVRGCSNWNDKGQCRDFDSLQLMNEALVERINHSVKENDVLYHLGDWSFGGFDNIKLFRDQVNCKNIHLVLGNHDHHILRNKNNIRSLFASIYEFGRYLVINKQMFILCHYSMRVWDKSHHGSIHLFGHSHGTLPGTGRSMDVGVDTNKLFPYHISEVMDIMSKKEITFVDHHNENTN